MFSRYFFVRRLLISVTLVFLNYLPLMQLCLQISFSMFNLCYMLRVWPYEQKLLNVLEIINEVCYYFIAVLFFGFSDLIDDPELKFRLGWPVIGIILFQIGANMCIIVSISIKNMFLSFKALLQYCARSKPTPE